MKTLFRLSGLREKAAGFFKKHRFWLGPVAGGVAGIMAGIPGILFGILLGHLVQELAGQLHSDRAATAYFENPGRSGFYEGEPGLAAWCALAVIILSESVPPENRGAAGGSAGASIGEEVRRDAVTVFPGAEKCGPLIESFCRLAESRRNTLNPDLLAESLAARRSSRGDLPVLGKTLHALASGDRSLQIAARIRGILDPGYRTFEEGVHQAAERLSTAPRLNSWEVLGLRPGASPEEIKSGFRRLAIQFHPDSLQALNKTQREAAAKAFMRIEEAYREIMKGETENV